MYYFVTASKDASIYLQQPTQNTGLDEVLEISKVYYGALKDVSRALIKFDTTPLSQSINTGEVTMSAADLILFECESNEIPLEYTIYGYPIWQDWQMGIGTRFDEITTSGVTWKSKTTGVDWLENTYDTGTTGSFNGYGGTWYTSSVVSQSFEYSSTDINMNVIEPFTQWISGSLPNNGLILKYSSDFENDTNDYGQIKLFSKETNTIYQPKVRIGWDDSSFQTGSLTELTESDIYVTTKRLKKNYKQNSVVNIRVYGRELYPLKTYTNQYSYTSNKYLPSTTYYQIRDSITEDIIIPFSEYSKVSCDSEGNFFRLNLTNWEPNREYYIEFKVERSGEIEYFSDDNLTFTVLD